MRLGHTVILGFVSALTWVALAGPARAGSTRHDVADYWYTSLAADPAYAPVGTLSGYHYYSNWLGSATLVDSRWVLTSAQLVDDYSTANVVFNVGGTDYSAVEWICHPNWTGEYDTGWDIALVRLSTAVTGVAPATRYTGSGEVGSVGTLVGFGESGTGLTGYKSGTAGTKRAGTNAIDLLGGSVQLAGVGELTDRTLLMDFDDPFDPTASSWGSQAPLAMEYLAAPGDYGAGVFVDVAGAQQLAGVVSLLASGPVGNADGSANADYGDVVGATRVSDFNAWIDDNLPTEYWNNPGGGGFATGANWLNGLAPGAADTAVFDVNGTYTVTLGADTGGRRLRVRDGSVTLDLGGNTYSLAASAENPSVVVGQSHNDGASLTISTGTLVAHDGVVAMLPGTSGAVTVTGQGTKWNLAGALAIGGRPEAQGGTGSVVVNKRAALNVGGALKIWTSGTLNLNGGEATAGGLDLAGGTITGSGPLTLTGLGKWTAGTMGGAGTTTVAAGATLEISGVGGKTLYSRRLVNAGTVAWQGTADLDARYGVVIENLAGAVWDAQDDARLDWYSGTAPEFHNAGTFRKSGGAGTTAIEGSFYNSGTVQVGSGTLEIGSFNSTGVVEAQAGALCLTGGGVSSGTFVTHPGASLYFSGNHNLTGATFDNQGALNLAASTSYTTTIDSDFALGGTVTLNGNLAVTGQAGFSNLTWTGGTMSGSGTTVIDAGGTLAIDGSGHKYLNGRTLISSGTTVLTDSGLLRGQSGAVFDNSAGAVFDVRSDADVEHNYSWLTPVSVLNNAGVVRKSDGAGESYISWTFNNTGTVEAGSGTLGLSAGGVSSGTFVTRPGALLYFSGNHNLTGAAFDNQGALNLAASTSYTTTIDSDLSLGGQVTVNGNLAMTGQASFDDLTWTAGTMSGSGTTAIEVGGTLTMSGSGYKYLHGRTLVNSGTTVLTDSGLLRGRYGAVFDNSAGAVLDIRSDADVEHYYYYQTPVSVFNNAGVVRKSDGTGESYISWTFNNTGTVEAGSGTLGLSAGGVSSGTFVTHPGALLYFSGNHDLTGATFDNQGALNLAASTSYTTTIDNDLGLPGQVTVGGNLSITGSAEFDDLTWTAGTMSGSGTTSIGAGATLTMSGNGYKYLSGRTLVNSGVTVLTDSGMLYGQSGAVFDNLAGAVFDIRSDADVNQYYSPVSVFTNAGVVRKSDGTGESYISWTFNNTGSVEVLSGTLSLSGGGASTGTFAVAPGAELRFAGGTFTVDNLAGLPGSGVTLADGTLLLPGDKTFDDLTWTGGTMAGTGTTSIPAGGTLTMSGSGYKYLSGRTLVNSGTTVLTDSGLLYGQSGAVFDNAAGAVFDIRGDADVEHYYSWQTPVSVFNNVGLVRKSDGTGESYISWAFNNAGSVEVLSGTLSLSAGGASTGTFAVAPGAELRFAGGTYTVDNLAGLPGSGVTLAGGTLSLPGDKAFDDLTWTGGSMDGTGTTTIPTSGCVEIDGSYQYLDGRTLDSAGSIVVTGNGRFRGRNGAVVNNQAGALFDVQGDADVQHYSGSACTFHNAGVLRKSAGTGVTDVSFALDNTGSVEVHSGTLQLSGGGVGSGTYAAAAGATLRFAGGTHDLAPAARIVGPGAAEFAAGVVNLHAGSYGLTGPVSVSGGSLAVTGEVGFDSITWTGGAITGSGTTAIHTGGTLAIDGDGAKLLDGRVVANAGSAVLADSGSLQGANGAIFHNLAGGVFDAASNADLPWTAGARPSFNNAGRFVKSGGGVTDVAWAMVNSGTVDVQAGTLQLAGGYTQTAGATMLSGGNVNVTGAGIDLQGGVVGGWGSIFGNVLNAAGSVAPGGSVGTITVSGAYVQSAAGSLVIELGGAGPGDFDVLNVVGPATLAGTLELGLIGGFMPEPGDEFRILSAGSLSGQFDTVTGDDLGGAYRLNALYGAAGLTLLAAIPGDATLDGPVDVFDLAVLGNNYGDAGMEWRGGDFTGDGVVDVFDLARLANNYGTHPPTGSQPIPEPASLAILAAGALVLVRRRRR